MTPLVEGAIYEHNNRLLRAAYIGDRWFLVRLHDGTYPPDEIRAYRAVSGGWLETTLEPDSVNFIDGDLLAIDPAALAPVDIGQDAAIDEQFAGLMAELSWEWQ